VPRIVAVVSAVVAASCGDGLRSPPKILPDAASLVDTRDPADGGAPDAREGSPDAGVRPLSCAAPPVVALEPLLRVDGAAVMVTAPPGDPRLFLVEKAGRITIAEGGVVRDEPFLDLRAVTGGPIDDFNEQGLLSLAFHPGFRDNGRFFVFYSTPDGNRVAELRVAADDGNRADRASERVVLFIPTISESHVGGMIAFAPDGMLWISTGDDYLEGDAPAQDLRRLHGKLLRIDVDGADPIPVDNPYAASADGPDDPRREIWALGLRNPWRWSFDAATGNVYVADVGEALAEEVNIVPAIVAGANYGWGWYEGDHLRYPGAPTGTVAPAVVHDHEDGWAAIIGGHVYRGQRFPALAGRYFYADWQVGALWTVRWEGGLAIDHCAVTTTPRQVTSIGVDGAGELYLTDLGGAVYRVVGE
jgi:glucose/arabinose dehydrogenase